MPDWFLKVVATGGPAAALIMTLMWWRAEQRAERYETLWIKANEKLPGRIIAFTEQHRQAYEHLTKAIWAQMELLARSHPSSLTFPPKRPHNDGGD